MKKILSTLASLIFGGTIGLFFVWYTIIYQQWGIFQYLVLMFAVCFFFVIHLVIHEVGHLVFGKLSGYQFSSIRFFSMALTKNKDGRFSFHRFNVPGTLGQCLMIPPKQEKFVFKLYLLGGGLGNLSMSLLALLILGIHNSYALFFCLVGVFMAVTNLIPTSFNDGMSYRLANSSKEQRDLLYLQLQVNYLTSLGYAYDELPEDYFQPIASNPKHTYFNDWQTFLIAGRYLIYGEWKEYRQSLECIWQNQEELILPYRLELKKELLFALCLTNPDDERITALWNDKQLKQTLRQPSISHQRLKAVYTKYVLKDDYAVQAMMKEIRQKKWTALNQGDLQSELEVIHQLEQHFLVEKEAKE